MGSGGDDDDDDGDDDDGRSQWSLSLLYTRCVCFGCNAKERKTGNCMGDNISISSGRDNHSLHHQTQKNEVKVALFDLTPDTAGESDCCRIPPTNMMALHNNQCVIDNKKPQSGPAAARVNGRSASLPSLSSSSRRGRMTSATNAQKSTALLSLLGAGEDQLVLLDVQYMTQAFRFLQSANRWSFNIFNLSRMTNGRSLFYMTLHLFDQCDFLRLFHLDVSRLMHCITLVESCYYFSNPYHNSVHAADVVQAMFVHLNEPQIVNVLNPVEKMAAILSAACHDVDHRGRNQGFLIASANPLCLLYNNESILENHHWRTTIAILHESKLFEHLDKNTWLRIRDLIRLMILATDITKQSDILSIFKGYLDGNSLNLSSNELHRNFILQILLKCADISNPCRPWKLSRRWSAAICEEFYKQGDSERSLGLPVTPFCDRTQSTISKIQTGFMTHVAEPLFVEWNRFAATSNSKSMLENLQHNRNQWESTNLTGAETVSREITSACEKQCDAENLEQKSSLNIEADKNVDNEFFHMDDDYSDLSSSELVTQNKRRHSLPETESVVFVCARRSFSRRFSLPNGVTNHRHHPVVFPLITSLAPLSENSMVCEESDRGLKIRRRSIEDNDVRRQQRKQLNPSAELTDDDRPEVVYVFSPENTNKCFNMEQCVEDDYDDRGGALSNGGQDPDDRSHGSHRHLTRKMSLIATCNQPAVMKVVGRKRSRSLVTSLLGGAVEGNLAQTSPHLLPNNRLSSEQLLATSSGELWKVWWQKNSKNNIYSTKAPTVLSEADSINTSLPRFPTSSSAVSVGRTVPPPSELLSFQRPALVSQPRLSETHCRSQTKAAAARKAAAAASVFAAAAEDGGESTPLLASVDNGSIWNNES